MPPFKNVQPVSDERTFKVLVCGGRDWWNRTLIHDRLALLPKNTLIIEGEARGADTIAKEEALKLGLKVKGYPAEWDKYGKGAGPIRNKQMLHLESPDLVIAFPYPDLKSSRGTLHMVTIAEQYGVRVEVIDGKG